MLAYVTSFSGASQEHHKLPWKGARQDCTLPAVLGSMTFRFITLSSDGKIIMLRTEPKNTRGSVVLLLAAIVFLTNCTSDHGPWPMPTGYTYHNDKYKAPPGPEPVFKKWEMEHGMSQAPTPPRTIDTHLDNSPAVGGGADMPVAASSPIGNDPRLWQSAADDLTGRLFAGFGKPAEALYIVPSDGSEDSRIFAAALRASLQQRGVPVADTQGGGSFALHTAIASVDGGGRRLLTVSLYNGPRKAAGESGLYNVTGAYSERAMPAPSGDGVPVVLSPSMSGGQ